MSRFAQLVNAAQARKHADISLPGVDAHNATITGAHLSKNQDAHLLKDEDAHNFNTSDAHILEIPDARSSINIDAHTASHVDTHNVDISTSTNRKNRRPHTKKVDTSNKSVGALASTKNHSVGTNTPTLKLSGRPHQIQAGVHKSDRHRADLIRQHFRITPELDEQFRMFRAKMKLDLQEFYTLAGVHFIEQLDAHSEKGVDALASHDDREMMIKVYATARIIIELYLQYNIENKWKVTDDQIARKYNDVDIRLIEVAIIRTQFNANFKKINSFKYYIPEIEETLAIPLGDETIKMMLERSRYRWNEAKAKT